MAATDSFVQYQTGLDSPYRHAVAITPHDSTELSFVSRAIYVGVAGDITLLTAEGETVLLKFAPVGVLRVRARRVNATATTATNLVALW